ncbi:MAG: glycoside hydrolase family 57 protein [Sulfuricurvum sp.]|uniref:glycoside hydrolase family 57 protein n=1 Tax=Sulfuricurvum sp. TaxID=2025608 RepID=UPI002614F5C5|nr:glycoside hydrolase family 57 protein [Sulfuricurvum sp.]MDD2829492.1 glycoside hydrolase family 57 protein [Sulfuricurvum sp.]MDD4949511.1 glycoside hydrolase family 57 protein [Sulfuricurvum sp.]
MKVSSLKLSFFWHMHQPDYRGSDGVMKMPWVFLHAIKDYYEMPWLLSKYSGLKATFNLSASLIEQLNLYQNPLQYDYFLTLWAKEPQELEYSQRAWLVKLMCAMQYETMVRPLKRYGELYYQEYFLDDELIELEVLFILAWCGNYLRLHNDVVKKLLLKERGYDSGDKEILLATLGGFVQEILPLYSSLQKQGIISVSTTPYFHPILPVLLDMENAARANSVTKLPAGSFSLTDDANEHIIRSIELYKETFGCEPSGFWPAEGGVDEKSVALYKENAIHWIATDEAILYKSLNDENPSLRYKPYLFDGVSIAFRDHRLSDLIGFEYRHQKGDEATHHFMAELEKIAQTEVDPSVFVIVDGENAWEFYDNNGFDFFSALYTTLSDCSWCKTVTMDEVAKFKNQGTLTHLAPGSWIHGTFDTWVGHSEKNRAWELIFQTQRDVATAQLSEDIKKKIKYHLLASECSDWFWWYGDDHSTDFAHEFDALFREHLIHIYRLMEMDIPLNLLEPILSNVVSYPFWIKPTNKISPLLNGEKNSFFEWMGCGSIDERRIFSTMDRLRGPVNIMYYGYDDTTLYIALEGRVSPSYRIVADVETWGKRIDIVPLYKMGRLEFGIPRESLGNSSELTLRFHLMEGETNLQSLPGFGLLNIDFNHQSDWYI